MIRAALHKELCSQYEASTVPPPAQLDPLQAQTLVLSFSNLALIDHLSSFTSLTKLQLDNNHITAISGLDALVSLTWLDLSFNAIRRIDGLQSLTKLTDLALSHNQIERITGLSHLHHTLQTLTLAHNCISSLEEVRCLRPFTALRLLVLKGNPMKKAGADDYSVNVFAFLPQLQYFDYVMVEVQQRLKARDAKLDTVLMLEQREAEREKEEAERVEAERRRDSNRRNGCEGIERLWLSVEEADGDMRKLKAAALPGLADRLTAYEQRVETAVRAYEGSMQSIGARKREEEEKVREVLQLVTATAEDDSKRAIKAFTQLSKAINAEFEQLTAAAAAAAAASSSASSPTPPSSLSALTALLNRYHSSLHAFISSLMSTEHQLSIQHEQLTDAFASALTAESQQAAQLSRAFFRSLLDTAKEHHDGLSDDVHTQLDSKDDKSTADSILSDKEAVLTMLSASRDCHEQQILTAEDNITQSEEKSLLHGIQSLRNENMQRNRQRVSEIYDIKRRHERRLQSLIDSIASDETEEEAETAEDEPTAAQ